MYDCNVMLNHLKLSFSGYNVLQEQWMPTGWLDASCVLLRISLLGFWSQQCRVGEVENRCHMFIRHASHHPLSFVANACYRSTRNLYVHKHVDISFAMGRCRRNVVAMHKQYIYSRTELICFRVDLLR